MSIHLHSAASSIRRSPFQALAAVAVLTITFLAITFLTVLIYSSNRIVAYFETRPQVIVFLKKDAPEREIEALRTKLLADTRVKEIDFVSKEEALGIYKKATVSNPLLGELVSPSVFPASLEFSLTDINKAEEVISEIKENGVVNQIGFTASLGGDNEVETAVTKLKGLVNNLRIIGVAVSVVLLFTSLIVIFVVISLRLTMKRTEVEILSLIGASSSFVRAPVVIESLIYSFIGVFLGWILTLIAVLYASPSLINFFKDIEVLPRTTTGLLTLFGIIFAGELLAGWLISVMGAAIAVSRARKNK